ncbi:MAG: AAA family ATPase [Candidatus Eremiobacteraeota bacterium]|nr:AAA family ATPase [Candidatus Eremiobacteraeota bacterium]
MVATVTFYSPDSGYTVVTLRDESGRQFKVVGHVHAKFAIGAIVEATGRWIDHHRFGRQFEAASLSSRAPSDKKGLVRYLAGALPGIGAGYAKRIAAHFGAKTEEALGDVNALSKVPGLGRKRAAKVASAWSEQRADRDALIYLSDLGLGRLMSLRVLRHFGGQGDVRIVLHANPFRLTEVSGVGFKIADEAAKRAGMPADSPHRIRAGLLFALEQRASTGHTKAGRSALQAEATKLLSVSAASIEAQIEHCVSCAKLAERSEESEPAYLLPYLDRAERDIAAHVARLGRHDPGVPSIEPREIPQRCGFVPDERQMEAFAMAASRGLSILTGGPGCGKTTLTRALCLLWRGGGDVVLAAPTGRAAKRLAEAAGAPAKTIHRLLEGQGDAGGWRFTYDRTRPLPMPQGSLLIVDEASMLDTQLAAALFDAVPVGVSILLVGDADQLPSVGPGNILADLIAAGVPNVRLQEIYRQASDSPIVFAASAVIQGSAPALPPTGECRLIKATRGDGSEVLAVMRGYRTAGVGLDDILVLTPMRRGPYGADALNVKLQALCNPHGRERGSVPTGRTIMLDGQPRQEMLCPGDRVMQISNDYERHLYNGDLLTVVGDSGPNSDERYIDAVIDDASNRQRTVRLSGLDLANLRLAYAATVHKAQGGQCAHVLLALMPAHYVMLTRRLLYTAMTRAQRSLTIVGEQRCIAMACKDVGAVTQRQTGLRELLDRGTVQARESA